MCFLLLPLEAVSAMGQKYNLPTAEVSVLEKLEQKKPLSSQPSELSPETTGKLGKPSGLLETTKAGSGGGGADFVPGWMVESAVPL